MWSKSGSQGLGKDEDTGFPWAFKQGRYWP